MLSSVNCCFDYINLLKKIFYLSYHKSIHFEDFDRCQATQSTQNNPYFNDPNNFHKNTNLRKQIRNNNKTT